jgi:hypothetical protein
MQVFVWVLFVLLHLASLDAAGAQTREEMERCRAIEDDLRRVACYDAIPLSRATAPSKYERVPLDELKEFALTYRGQLVEVTGWITPGQGDLLFLGSDEDDGQPVPIDFESLPRQELRSFLDACGGGCDATVQGRVRPVNFTTGIVADALIVH